MYILHQAMRVSNPDTSAAVGSSCKGRRNGVVFSALDVYEHVYHIDFGANATAYVDTFLRNIDWQAVEGRFDDAIKVAPPRPLVQEEFGALPGDGVEEVRAMQASSPAT